MLTLSTENLQKKEEWKQIGVELPSFDIEAMMKKTKEAPSWIHFGSGNIFRAFIAELQQQLLNSGRAETGIVATEAFDYDIIDKIYTPYNNLSLQVLMKPDGTLDKKIVASVAESLKCSSSHPEHFNRLKEIFRNSSLQMVSFTITEKGYALSNIKGEYLPVVYEDMKKGPAAAVHIMSLVTALVYERYLSCRTPIALVSMDNCSHNGEKLQSAMFTIADAWLRNGFVDEGFVKYLKDETIVSFPWSMIDKITPRPSQFVKQHLEQIGIGCMEPIITSKNTFIAPFVNTEVPQYLVVEDKFPNGRPSLEYAGVFFTDRDTVNKTERMKVSTCLNPLHTALAIFGCLLGYTSIAEEMKDPELKILVEKIGYAEGMPVVTDPKILSPVKFIHEVIDERLPNPFIPDTPQRIATDTSQKMGIRFGETIKSYMERDNLHVTSLIYIPLTIAGWCRYLLGFDDSGKPMELSPDPMLEELRKALDGIVIGRPESFKGNLKPILSNPMLFAVDLYEAGLGPKIEGMFLEMIAGKGAVRNTLKKYASL